MRRKLRVADLAQEANLDVDAALIILMDAGFTVAAGGDFVSKSRCAEARRHLGLPSTRVRRSIPKLAERAGMPQDEARRRLIAAGVVLAGITTVPKRLMREAERALSLPPTRQPPTSPKPTPVLPAPAPEAFRQARAKPSTDWPKVGNVDAAHFLSATEVEQIHWALVRDFARSRDPMSPPGVRSVQLLESAVFRPHTSLGSTAKYPTMSMAGAALFHSLVKDHPFHNGNKRDRNCCSVGVLR